MADELVADCLRELKASLADVKLLGSYPAAGADGPRRRAEATEAFARADDWIRGWQRAVRAGGAGQ